MKRLAIVGVGKMGSEILKSFQSIPHRIEAVEINKGNRLDLPTLNWEIHPSIDCLKGDFHSMILAVKPNDALEVSKLVNTCEEKSLFRVPCIVSCMAGVSSRTLGNMFPHKKIVRIMPNIGIGSGNGLTSVYGPNPYARQIRSLFVHGGVVHDAKSDDEIDAVTCIASSGPAYFLRMAQIMADEAESMGLSELEAKMIARSALLSASLLPDATKSINEIASTGGTTERALRTLEQNKFAHAVRSAIRQSWCRAKNIDSNVRHSCRVDKEV